MESERPWELEPDPAIRARKKVKAERALLSTANVITCEDEMPRFFCFGRPQVCAVEERRQSNPPRDWHFVDQRHGANNRRER